MKAEALFNVLATRKPKVETETLIGRVVKVNAEHHSTHWLTQ